ncbi:MAG: hypothetical protein ACO3S2_09545, partial [Burkholderiaceae bacterium]
NICRSKQHNRRSSTSIHWLATFGPDGPLQCSGLPVVRYDSTELAAVFKDAFELTDSALENHTTPAGKTQQFLYAVLRRF